MQIRTPRSLALRGAHCLSQDADADGGSADGDEDGDEDGEGSDGDGEEEEDDEEEEPAARGRKKVAARGGGGAAAGRGKTSGGRRVVALSVELSCNRIPVCHRDGTVRYVASPCGDRMYGTSATASTCN